MAIQLSQTDFVQLFSKALTESDYTVHPKYSVFTQYDGPGYYEPARAAFEHKYRIFSTITRVLQPECIIELGTHAGSGAHAYLHGAPKAKYIGYDIFGSGQISSYDGKPWQPFEVATNLLTEINASFSLVKGDLRNIQELPLSDFVVVDAAHDFTNAYLDCLLAHTAKPQYIWVDDYSGHDVAIAVGEAAAKSGNYEWWHRIEYINAGLIIKMKQN